MKQFWNRTFLTGTFLLASHAVLLAQGAANATEETKSASWAIPYIIVVLATAGILWVVCQPSKRRDKAKKDD